MSLADRRGSLKLDETSPHDRCYDRLEYEDWAQVTNLHVRGGKLSFSGKMETWQVAYSPFHARGAHEVTLAKRRTFRAQDVVGGRSMKIKIRKRE